MVTPLGFNIIIIITSRLHNDNLKNVEDQLRLVLTRVETGASDRTGGVKSGEARRTIEEIQDLAKKINDAIAKKLQAKPTGKKGSVAGEIPLTSATITITEPASLPKTVEAATQCMESEAADTAEEERKQQYTPYDHSQDNNATFL